MTFPHASNVAPAELAAYWRDNARIRSEAADTHPDHPCATAWRALAQAAETRAEALEKEVN